MLKSMRNPKFLDIKCKTSKVRQGEVGVMQTGSIQ